MERVLGEKGVLIERLETLAAGARDEQELSALRGRIAALDRVQARLLEALVALLPPAEPPAGADPK